MNSTIKDLTEQLAELKANPMSSELMEDFCLGSDSAEAENSTEVVVDIEDVEACMQNVNSLLYVKMSSNDDNHISEFQTYMNSNEFKNALKDSKNVALNIRTSEGFSPSIGEITSIQDCLLNAVNPETPILWGCTSADSDKNFFDLKVICFK